MGVKPQTLERMLQESKWSGWRDLWQLPMNAYTTSGNADNTGGRPRSDDSVLTDSGEASREMLE